MLLFVNGCTRSKEVSNTYKLAQAYLKGWKEAHPDDRLETIELVKASLAPLTQEESEERERQANAKAWEHPLLKQGVTFAKADEIVIAAPYWDLSFPAIVRIYLEHVCISGITFGYEAGVPKPMCQAKKVVYITTSGGFIGENRYGSDYIKGLCREFFGIPEVKVIDAQGLDIQELDASVIMNEALEKAYGEGRR